MSFFRRLIRNRNRKAFVVVSLAVLALSGALVLFFRFLPDIERPSLVLKALLPARCAGEAWGTDLFIAATNEGLLKAKHVRIKDIMGGLFAQAVIQKAPWDRPIDDLKYMFRTIREERLQRMPGIDRFFHKAKIILVAGDLKRGRPDDQDEEALKALREEEKRTAPGPMRKRYQAVLGESDSALIKAHAAAREIYLKEIQFGEPGFVDRRFLAGLSKNTELPLGLELYLTKLKRSETGYGATAKPAAEPVAGSEQKDILSKYRAATGALKAGDYSGFIDKSDALLEQYPDRDFSPLLLFQVWSVLKHDLRDKAEASDRVSQLKTRYPFSLWGRNWKKPERPDDQSIQTAPSPSEVLTRQADLLIGAPSDDEVPWLEQSPKETGKRSIIDTLTEPMNFARSYFSGLSQAVFMRLSHAAAGLEPGKIYDETLDKAKARQYLDHFIPMFAKKVMRGYDIDFDENGISVWTDLNMGVINIRCSAKGKIEAHGAEGARYVTLDLQGAKIQGLPIPQAILNEAERGFSDTWRAVNMPIEVGETDYWQGGARVAFKRKSNA